MSSQLLDHSLDFTTEHYRSLLQLAKKQYTFKEYSPNKNSPNEILWRHDVDLSLNRALALAKLEAEEGVVVTYFLNIRSEFYNCFEQSQLKIIKEISSLGHKLGLHFDATENYVSSETDLENKIASEAEILRKLVGVEIDVFSFHNPTSEHLRFEKEFYANLINTYSSKYKNEYDYCSDSNGYWRFESLKDKVSKKSKKPLQVLTHPGWWQDTAIPPRQRVLIAAYGRAFATMRLYDKNLTNHNRISIIGDIENLHKVESLFLNNDAFFDFFIAKNSPHILGSILQVFFKRQICEILISIEKANASIWNETFINEITFKQLSENFNTITGFSLEEVVEDSKFSFHVAQNTNSFAYCDKIASYMIALARWCSADNKIQTNGFDWYTNQHCK